MGSNAALSRRGFECEDFENLFKNRIEEFIFPNFS
jgi:hypothetical protein